MVKKPPKDLSLLDQYLDEEGEKYREITMFTARENINDMDSEDIYPYLNYAYYTIIASAGFIGDSMDEVYERSFTGVGSYIGNIELALPVYHGLKAGLITRSFINCFGIETSLDLESFIVNR